MNKKYLVPFIIFFLCPKGNSEEIKNLDLSLQESIEMSVSRNFDIKIESLNPEIQNLEVQKIRNSFNLVLGFTPEIRGNIQPTSNSFIAGGTRLEQLFQNYNLYFKKKFESGGELSLRFDNAITGTNSTRVDFNPIFAPALSLNFNHPILKNSFNGSKRILIGENMSEIALINLKSKLIDTINQTKQTYWNLVASKLKVEVFESSLKLSQELLKDNKERLKAGFASKIDILNAETAIAARQEALFQAKNDLGNSQDNLKRLINPDEKFFQNWEFNINTKDIPKYTQKKFNIDELYKKALERPDYKVSLINSKNIDIQKEINEKNKLPVLDINSSVGLQTIDRNYPSSIQSLFSFKGYFWNVGLNFEIPVQGNLGETEYKQSVLNQSQQKLIVENLKQKIYNELRNNLRLIETNKNRINSNSYAKKLAQEQLNSENEKLKAGFSTSFQILQYQRDLEQAKLNELNAIIDYLKSLSSLEQITGTAIEDNNLKI